MRNHDDALLKSFASIPVSCVVDAMMQLGIPDGAMEPSIRQVAGPRIVGRARTVGRIPKPRNIGAGDYAGCFGPNLYALVDSLTFGQVLVISTQQSAGWATFGDNLALRASLLGAVGVVTDSAVRDTLEIDALSFGAFAAGVSLRPGDDYFLNLSVDEPIVCGGVLVRPNDIVLGDTDGVVVVRAEQADQVWKRAVEICDADQEKQEMLRQGTSLVEASRRYHIG